MRTFIFLVSLTLMFNPCATRVTAATLTVPTGSDPIANGTNFQNALDNARCGDTIILQAGSTYRGAFILRNKGACTGTDADYITIQTPNLAGISAPGQRLNPTIHGAALAKIVAGDTVNRGPAVSAESLAHHYTFIGIEFTNYSPNQEYYNLLVSIGQESG